MRQHASTPIVTSGVASFAYRVWSPVIGAASIKAAKSSAASLARDLPVTSLALSAYLVDIGAVGCVGRSVQSCAADVTSR